MSEDLALIDAEDLSLVDDSALNSNQLDQILKRTPKKYIKERPGKGGKFKYVTGGYMKKCLNLMFGFDWDFEIISENIYGKQIVVKGRLTCRTNGKEIVKMQFGGKDIAYKKNTEDPLDLGNDFKAAATDALKKCAAEIGIAADVYNAEEFKEIRVDTSEPDWLELSQLFDLKRDSMNEDEIIHVERILKEKEVNSYKKLLIILKSK